MNGSFSENSREIIGISRIPGQMFNPIFVFSFFVLSLMSCKNSGSADKTKPFRLVTLDPGHFHAALRAPRSMLMPRQGVRATFCSSHFREWCSGRLLGADKTGKGRSGWEGKLLGGHVQQVGWGPGTAGESLAGQHGCGSRLESQAAPGASGAVSRRRRGGGGRPGGRRTVSGSG